MARTGIRTSWRLTRLCAAGAALLVVCCLAGPLAAETRVALVLGNAAYGSKPLANPKNDAQLVAETLRSVGFEVSVVTDADQPAMKRAILEFGRRLRSGDSVGIFYYAGHGVQVDGENYLIPIGADIRDAEEVALAGVNLTEILKTMERASSRLNVAILDACRDNPFPSSARSLGRGLAPVTAPSGTLIAYATAPGQVALDGTGRNSPYTQALAEAIRQEGLALEEVFRRARRSVLDITGGRQTPWEHSSLTGDFYFRPKIARPEGSVRDDRISAHDADVRFAELAAWETIRSSSDPVAFRRHVDTYPDGLFRELAEIRISHLTAKPQVWSWSLSNESATRSAAEIAFEKALSLDEPGAGDADLTEVAGLYKTAAEGGLVAAMYQLARAYDKGRGVGRDLGAAAEWYRRAADLGHAGAMASLGTMYEFGEGAERNLAEAVRLYRLGAEKGDPHALTSLAFLHAEGKGVARDLPAARSLYAQAADKGQPRAMYNLALILLKPPGNVRQRDTPGMRDLTEAVRLLEAAGRMGHAGAQRELAVLYDEGRGVARNPPRAADLLLAAYKAGNEQARADVQRRPESWSYATRRQVQRLLAEKGLYAGRAHGYFDRTTRQALDRLALQD